MTGLTRAERLAWLAVPLGLVGIIVLFLTVGSLGERRADLQRIEVAEVLAAADPVQAYGSGELQLVGWYADLAADCIAAPDEPADPTWLERTCPFHVLLAEQPASGASQAALESIGLRLAAPTGEPFPPRSRPTGWHLMLEPRIVIGHFDDPAASACAPSRIPDCRRTFVVTEIGGLVH